MPGELSGISDATINVAKDFPATAIHIPKAHNAGIQGVSNIDPTLVVNANAVRGIEWYLHTAEFTPSCTIQVRDFNNAHPCAVGDEERSPGRGG